MIVNIKSGEKLIEGRLNYVLDFINSHPFKNANILFSSNGNNSAGRTIYYGGKSEAACFYVPSQRLFFKSENIVSEQLCINKYNWNKGCVHAIESTPVIGTKTFFEDNSFGFDVFETIFFHISRYEEYYALPEDLNSMDRLDESKLLVQRYGVEQIPVVDLLVKAFFEALGMEVNERKTEFVLTHDIDKIFKYNNLKDALKAFTWPIVYRYDPLWGIRNLKAFLQVKLGSLPDPYDSYNYLFRQSEIWTRKIVYFMSGGVTRFDLYDKYYRKDFDLVYKKAKEYGYETGLHPSFNTCKAEHLLVEEMDNFYQMTGETAILSRQHYLHFDYRVTPGNLIRSGIKNDSSVGFTRKIGFKSGTGFDHKLYDFEREKAYEIMEMPLVVMDSSLIHQSGGDLDLFKEMLFSFIRKNSEGTRIVFNFHNSTFDYTVKSRKILRTIYDELEAFLESL